MTGVVTGADAIDFSRNDLAPGCSALAGNLIARKFRVLQGVKGSVTAALGRNELLTPIVYYTLL